ncbi:MAG: hypothetical protein QOJ81_1636 [Chloroflexota bacterium]|jgi:hypothetical protein|nr:hypothetical protein [Chloroflexota bacterium]
MALTWDRRPIERTPDISEPPVTEGGAQLTTDVVKRTPSWRVLMWVGVVGSVLAWAWVWYLGRGPTVVMLLFALAAVAFAYRATAGSRWAMAGLMVTGLAMFLASLYWLAALYTSGGSFSVADVFSASVIPLVAAMFLLAGAATGFRHIREA